MCNLILPITETVKHLDECLSSLNKIQDINVVPVFNNCRERFVDEVLDKYEYLVYDKSLISSVKLRPAAAINLGIKYIQDDFIVLNPECVVTEDMKHLLKQEGIVSATTICLSNDIEERLKELNNHTISKVIDWPTKDCLFVPYEVIKQIGFFDSWYTYDYWFEDFYTRAQLKDITLERMNIYVHNYLDNEIAEGLSLFSRQQFYLKYSMPMDYTIEMAKEHIRTKHKWHEEMKLNA